jgi:hypothetical protein
MIAGLQAPLSAPTHTYTPTHPPDPLKQGCRSISLPKGPPSSPPHLPEPPASGYTPVPPRCAGTHASACSPACRAWPGCPAAAPERRWQPAEAPRAEQNVVTGRSSPCCSCSVFVYRRLQGEAACLVASRGAASRRRGCCGLSPPIRWLGSRAWLLLMLRPLERLFRMLLALPSSAARPGPRSGCGAPASWQRPQQQIAELDGGTQAGRRAVPAAGRPRGRLQLRCVTAAVSIL